ncbi:hypothetical protein NPIL_420941 [Nephila pilipes]|uniref:Uncharacterized protein n=1 Tax=Nephila pilipes TaxID=299642 RepID=A0A8X6UCL2_NEPPI|nr:hypothetical protein NPIL_420941 [Nephila pilipes]
MNKEGPVHNPRHNGRHWQPEKGVLLSRDLVGGEMRCHGYREKRLSRDEQRSYCLLGSFLFLRPLSLSWSVILISYLKSERGRRKLMNGKNGSERMFPEAKERFRL